MGKAKLVTTIDVALAVCSKGTVEVDGMVLGKDTDILELTVQSCVSTGLKVLQRILLSPFKT